MSALGLKIVSPVQLTEAMIVSTSVPENEFVEWKATTNYAVGTRVILLSTHSVYQRLIAGTSSTPPNLDTVNWVYVSPTNRYKLADQSGGSKTTASTTISYVIQPGRAFDTVAALGVTGSAIRLRVFVPDVGTIYDETRALQGGIPSADWYTYFYAIGSEFDQLVAQGVRKYFNAQIMLDVEPVGGVAAIATLVFGSARQFGEGIEYGAEFGIQDYSQKLTDQFGTTQLVQRSFARRARVQMMVPMSEADSLFQLMVDRRAKATLWITTSEVESGVIYGFYRDFSQVVSYPTYTVYEIELEGLA